MFEAGKLITGLWGLENEFLNLPQVVDRKDTIL